MPVLSLVTLQYSLRAQMTKKALWMKNIHRYMAWNGLCFMVHWISYQVYLKEVGVQPENWTTLTLQNPTILDGPHVQ